MCWRWRTSSSEAHSGSRREPSATWPGTSPIRCRAVRAFATSRASSSSMRSPSARCASRVLLALLELDLVHRDDRLHLAGGRGEERLARLAAGRRACTARSSTSTVAITRWRVIEARMCSSSGGVQSDALRRDPEDGRGGRLEHAPVRGHEQGLVEAALLREPRGEHVARVGERLHPVEHPRGRVGDGAQPDRGRQLVELLGEQQAPAAAGEHQPQRPVERRAAPGLEQVGDLGLELRARHLGEPQARGGALRAGRGGRRARTGARCRRGSPRTPRRRAGGPRRWPG